MTISAFAASGVLLVALGTVALASHTLVGSVSTETTPFQGSMPVAMACVGQIPTESVVASDSPSMLELANCARMSAPANFPHGSWESLGRAFPR